MTAQLLYNRAYGVALLSPSGGDAIQYGNITGMASALRVQLEIEKGQKDSPNKAKISLFNLSLNVREALGKGWLVRVKAGYQGLTETLFVGAAAKATSRREGPDIITDLECADGEKALLASVYHQAYPPGTTLPRILQDVAGAMDVDPGIALGIPKTVYTRGITVHGSCRDILTRLLRKEGVEFSVQNGRLNIIPLKHHNGRQALILSAKTGLIGVPSISGTDITFEALLNPRLVPGQLVRVDSKNQAISGYAKIRSTKVEADSHDAKWQVTCTCNKVLAPIQELTAAQGFNYGQAAVDGLL